MARPTTSALRAVSGVREPVVVASTANIDLTTGGLLTIDGVTLTAGQRVLVKDQDTASENGIYEASSGEWMRSGDGRSTRHLQKGVVVRVQSGTVNSDKAFRFTATEPAIGTDSITIAEVLHDGDVASASDITNDSGVDGTNVDDALDTLDTAISAKSSNFRCRAATTANVTIATALNNGDTLDGVTLQTGDNVLVKDQTAAEENGIYVVGTTPARADEFDTYNKHPGILVSVEEGTVNGDTFWYCSSDRGGTLDTTDIDWKEQFGGLATQGDVPYYGASGVPDKLSAGTSGQFLKTQGAAANPTFAWTAVVQTVYTSTAATTAITAAIPADDSVPTSSEGTEALSAAITPKSASNHVLVSGVINVGISADAALTVAVFRGTTCIGVFGKKADSTSSPGESIPFSLRDSPSTTSETTYSVRVGKNTGTVALNTDDGTNRIHGGARDCTMLLAEVA